MNKIDCIVRPLPNPNLNGPERSYVYYTLSLNVVYCADYRSGDSWVNFYCWLILSKYSSMISSIQPLFQNFDAIILNCNRIKIWLREYCFNICMYISENENCWIVSTFLIRFFKTLIDPVTAGTKCTAQEGKNYPTNKISV